MNQYKKDLLYTDLAFRIAQESHAMRNKVGCVIVKEDRILSMGYNGMPSGFDNTCEDELRNSLVTKKEVLHAELNAIAKIASTHESSLDATLYITLGCCIDCAKLVIQSKIKRVVYLDDYRDMSGIELLTKANIIVDKFIKNNDQ